MVRQCLESGQQQPASGLPVVALRPQRPLRAHGCVWIARRLFFCLLAAGAGTPLAGLNATARAENALSASQATQFIQQEGSRLVAVLNGPGDWPEKQKRLQALINETMDVSGIARFALGRFWNSASEAQRQEYVALFPAVLLAGVGRTIGGYQGVSFTIDRAIQLEERVQVWTTVNRANAPPTQVAWIVEPSAGTPKIGDIIAQGASLRITERDDCTSFLSHNNYSIQALIETLRRQVAES
jgi:phospholipid transport system substrate-binding protein